jgi:Flp pilus assembly protein TadD
VGWPRLAQVTSGELSGAALVGARRHRARIGQWPGSPPSTRGSRPGFARAEPELHAAAAAGLQSADIFLGLATCLGRRRDLAGAERALGEARRLEPDNPTVVANIGLLQATRGDVPGAIQSLNAALAIDPGLHEARFNLALMYARSGRRAWRTAGA